jgi:glycosyltransferase involved in cell wall biosynthesis
MDALSHGPLRVLIVASEFPPVGGGGVVRMAKLARYLPEAGCSVVVLCTEPIAVEHFDDSLLADIPPDVRIMRVARPFAPVPGSRSGSSGSVRVNPWRPAVLGRRIVRAVRDVVSIPDPFVWWAIRASRSPREHWGEPMVVIASGPPHSSLIAGSLVARGIHVPLIIDLRDEWTLNPYYRTRNPVRRLLERRLETWCVRRAAALVFVSEVSATRYRTRYPWAAARIRVIPNGYDPADLHGLSARRARRPGEPIVICHAGSLHARRDPGPFFESLGRLLASRPAGAPRVELLLLGIIGQRQADEARRAIPASALRIEPFVVHSEAIARAAASDVLLVISNSEEAGPAALTGKVFEYLAIGKPILAITPPGPAADLIRRSGAGVTADSQDPGAIDEAIRTALELAERPEFRGATEEFLAPYDRSRQARTWAQLAADVVNRHDGSLL